MNTIHTAMENERKPTVTIVGSGICGMFTGLALDRRGFDVTVIERDIPPPDCSANEAFFSWARRGVAQFRHPHAFLGLMCSVLEENYPDLLEHFFEAGARKVSFEDSVPDHLKSQYQPEPGDEKMWVLMCRRATMETVLRKYVTQTSSVTIRNQISVTGIIANSNDDREVVMQGLKLVDRSDNDKRSELYSDLIIDATGRSSKFDKWLRDYGVEIKEERDDAENRTSARAFARLLEEGLPGSRAAKRKRDDEEAILEPAWFTADAQEKLRAEYAASGPYAHAVLSPLALDARATPKQATPPSLGDAADLKVRYLLARAARGRRC